jgi:hypothetical protein
MSDNLAVELLRAIRGDLRGVQDKLKEHDRRFTRIDIELAAIRRQAAIDAEAGAEFEVRFDSLVERVDRIERRLDLSDAPAS